VSTSRIEATFARVRARGRAAFMPFVSAGDPNLDATREIICELHRRGADIIELGVPFSDPIADGPTVQSSFTRALEAGVTVQGVLDMVQQLRAKCDIPLVTMISFSLVNRFGVKEYCEAAARAGVDGLIVPDLPVEEASALIAVCSRLNLCTVFLVAPTTSPERMRLIAQHSTGFIYYISVAGTTGARSHLAEDMRERITALRKLTDKPIAVGFGVSTPEQVSAVAHIADGVIVGSALVRKINEQAGRSLADMARAVGDFAEALAQATRGG
jgi:tryptophan synthase alpha chain